MSKGELKSCTIGICDGFNLLLPDNLIGDVVSAIGITALDHHEPWFIGQTEWRGLQLPVVSIEQLIRNGPARIRGSHIAVFRGTEDPSRLPFYGIPFQAAPHSYPINNAGELTLLEDAREFDFCLQKVRVRGVSTLIPNLEGIEQRLIETLPGKDSEPA